jgi:hypothetical protein
MRRCSSWLKLATVRCVRVIKGRGERREQGARAAVDLRWGGAGTARGRRSRRRARTQEQPLRSSLPRARAGKQSTSTHRLGQWSAPQRPPGTCARRGRRPTAAWPGGGRPSRRETMKGLLIDHARTPRPLFRCWLFGSSCGVGRKGLVAVVASCGCVWRCCVRADERFWTSVSRRSHQAHPPLLLLLLLPPVLPHNNTHNKNTNANTTTVSSCSERASSA